MDIDSEQPLDPDEFRVLVERAGLDLTPDERTELQRAFEPLRAQLRQLHSTDLGMRDPAVEFDARHTVGEA